MDNEFRLLENHNKQIEIAFQRLHFIEKKINKLDNRFIELSNSIDKLEERLDDIDYGIKENF